MLTLLAVVAVATMPFAVVLALLAAIGLAVPFARAPGVRLVLSRARERTAWPRSATASPGRSERRGVGGYGGPVEAPMFSDRSAEQAPAPLHRGRGHEDHDLALIADRERVHRVGEPGAEERRDSLALEEGPDDQRLGLVASMDLREAAIVARLGRARESDDPAAAAHTVL